jgi:outer membrane protein TolC
MSRKFTGLVAACLFMFGSAHGSESLSLPEAERLALERDPAAQGFTARAEALRAEAVADGQLPDPKLRFGLENVPTRDFSLDAEPMTQLTVGVVQEFPRGDSRALRERRTLALAGGEEAKRAERRLQALRDTRRAWLDTWYQSRALEAVHASRDLFERSVAITEEQYAAGRESQQAVLEARMELARLADRENSVQAALDTARAELARWIGTDAERPLPPDEVPLPPVEPLAVLQSRLPQHPALGGDAAEILAAETETQLARQEYKPGFALDLSYGKRFGEDAGVARSDLVTAMVEMEMPLFTGKRQDQRLAASQRTADAARNARDDRLRELRARVESAWSTWQRLGERLERYRREVVAQAALNATAADHAYRNRTAGFDTLVRAQLADLEARLEALRLESERGQVQADLAYFGGETP